MGDYNYIVSQVNANAAPIAAPTFTGAVTMTGTLGVNGALSASSSLAVSGAATVGSIQGPSGTLTVTGILSLSSELTNTAQPAFMAYRNGTQQSGTTVVFNTLFGSEQGSGFNTSNGIFTAPNSGWYLLCASVGIVSLGAGANQGINILVNGTAVAGSSTVIPSGTSGFGAFCSCVAYLSSGQTASVAASGAAWSSSVYVSSGQTNSFSGAQLF